MERTFTRKTLILCWSIVWGLCLVAMSNIELLERVVWRDHGAFLTLFFAPCYAFMVWLIGGVVIAMIIKFGEGMGLLK